MARSRSLFGPYEVHPDGAVLTSFGRRDLPLTRAGHGDLVELADGTPWIAYLCGRPLPGRERCILGRETALQPMQWGDDGWLRTLHGDALPDAAPPGPDLPPAPWPDTAWNGDFDAPILPEELQWLRTPYPEALFSLTERPRHLRLYGRESLGSHFTQALVARRQQHFRYTVTTRMEFDPGHFQQAAGLICYYNGTKYHYLFVTRDGDARQLQVMSSSPDEGGSSLITVTPALPQGPIDLRVDVDLDQLRFAWRLDGDPDWQLVPDVFDASVLSDEVSFPGLPNFTGAFVGMACQDLAGTAAPADFAWFRYEGRDPD
jgi:xylan 1,4-beta-xylosidase